MKRTFGAAALAALAAGLAWAAVGTKQEWPKPQKEHEFLKRFEGTWDTAVSFRMGADQEWMTSKGVETDRMLGGFWLVSEHKGDMGGTPFQGLGMTGYDPFKKKYVSTWVDNFGPCLSTGEGTVDGDSMTTTISSTGEDGKPMTMKMKQTIKDKDTVLWSMTMAGKDGKEFEGMKGEAKRKK